MTDTEIDVVLRVHVYLCEDACIIMHSLGRDHGHGHVNCLKEKIPMEARSIFFKLESNCGVCLGRVVEGGNLGKGINRPTIYTLPE